MRYLKLVAQVGVGVAILLWLLQLADAGKVLDIVLSLNPMYLLLASGFLILASTMTGLALYTGLRSLGLNPSARKAVMASFGGQLLSDVTPARSGYLLTPFILNKMDGIPVESGMASVVGTGIANSFVKVALSLVALAYFIRVLPLDPMVINALIVGVFLLFAGGVGLLVLVWVGSLPRLAEKFRELPMLGKAMGKIIEALDRLQSEGRRVRGALPQIAFFMVLSTVASAIALYTISIAILHPSTPTLLDFVLMAPLVSALVYVPATIAGLGVQEGGYVILLTLLGSPFERAVAFALIARLLFTGTDVIGLQPLLRTGFRPGA